MVDKARTNRLVGESLGWTIRETDEWIVRGIRNSKVRCYTLYDPIGNQVSALPRRTAEQAWADGPDFADDLTAAWSWIVPAARALNWTVRLENDSCEVFHDYHSSPDVVVSYVGVEKASDALCRAWLAANGIEVDDEPKSAPPTEPPQREPIKGVVVCRSTRPPMVIREDER